MQNKTFIKNGLFKFCLYCCQTAAVPVWTYLNANTEGTLLKMKISSKYVKEGQTRNPHADILAGVWKAEALLWREENIFVSYLEKIVDSAVLLSICLLTLHTNAALCDRVIGRTFVWHLIVAKCVFTPHEIISGNNEETVKF